LLLYAGGFGWGGEFKDYAKFHGVNVARTVNVGSPQVTAKVLLLEDWGQVPAGFFDAGAPNGDPQPLRTELIDEPTLRRNLLPADPIVWPTLENGSLEGNVTTWIVVDREGKVRDIETVVSENSGVNEIGRSAVTNMRFKPFVVEGVPVQVMSQITIPFKTTRPIGNESFQSAQEYFEKGRKAGFPAAGSGTPYVLRAEFELKDKTGAVVTGRYEDTWLSDSQWRREAWLGNSHFVRSKSQDKRYRFAEGEQSAFLALVFRMMEPIPAIDTFVESDWRIKRDTVNGLSTVRVLTGYEGSDGKLDPVQARGYWFDDTGQLLKSYFRGIETERSEFSAFGQFKVAHRIDALKDGKLAMRIRVTELNPAGDVPESKFRLPGHEWERIFTPSHKWDREFTDEVR
jgi:hypothetical protein